MKNLWLVIALLCTISTNAANRPDMVVAADGSGDYTTLTEAIDHLPYYNYQRLVIYVRNGVYNEKIRIEKDFITIRGESRDSTIIEYAQLREDWQKKPDVIGPAVINIHADDIVLENLTVRNTQPLTGPHAFTIFGTGTRTILSNCTVTSKGGDTVSLWNYKEGMYYHSNCYFEGCVDFVCPRGWCYISDSHFHQLKQTATLWHAGVDDINKKMVLKNCSFSGVEGYDLGRHHYEAQFWLINCRFGRGMADQPIYYVSYKDKPERNRPYFWKNRYYFSGCKGEGFSYDWFKDNFSEKGLSSDPDSLDACWTFNKQWNPENQALPQVLRVELISNNDAILYMDEPVGIEQNTTISTAGGTTLVFVSGKGRDMLLFKSEKPLRPEDFKGKLIIRTGSLFGNTASLSERRLGKDQVLKMKE